MKRAAHESGIFAFRAGAIICVAGAVLESIEGQWIGAIIFFCFGLTAATLAALAAMDGEEP